jgi:spermidine/putrescine transport system permease protein
VLAFYVVLSISLGTVDAFQNAVPVWQPWYWSAQWYGTIWQNLLGNGEIHYAPFFIRTLWYAVIASSLCVLIGYPVAYYVARYGGRRKPLFLLLMIIPFWVSYLMRMLAWVSLLQTDGYINRILVSLHIIATPYDWLGGKSITVVLGLVYGYIPYMILPLYAGLDRIGQDLIEASRDLGASAFETFRKVTLPLSRPAILAGLVIASLPMFGDYYTTYILSGRPGQTGMIGTLIDDSLSNQRPTQAAALVMVLTILLLIPMIYYLREQSKELSRQ